jgi:hypothetical protein
MAWSAAAEAADAQITRRDSSGVTIITQSPARRVRLGEPVLTIDGSEGGREPFFQINDNGVLALSDGLVVANAASELRYYTRDGRFRRAVGGRGGGPGEFQFLSWIQRLADDSVAAYDGRLRRLSVWTRDGRPTRAALVPRSSMTPAAGAFATIPATPTGMFADGTLLFVSSVSLFAHANGIRRARGWLLRSAADAAIRDTLAEIAVIDYGPRAGTGPATQSVAFLRMFSRSVTGAGFSMSEGDEYRIEHFNAVGRRIASVRVRRDHAAVRDLDRRLWRTHQPEVDALFPTVFPSYSKLWHDTTGRLWAELFRPPTAPTRSWDVFDPSGRLLVTIETAGSVRLVTADAARAYGIHEDELDVQRIQAFDLPRVLRQAR